MPTQNQPIGLTRPTVLGPGSSLPPTGLGTATSDQTLKDWRERCGNESACWLVLRLMRCKINWLTPSGAWSLKQQDAAIWTDREACYQQAQRSTGLLYLYDRQ